MSGFPSSDGDPQPAAADCYPLKLEPSFRERVWGREDISFLYPSRPREPSRVGEVWLTSDANLVTNGVWAGRTLGDLCRLHAPEILGHPAQHSRFPGQPAFPLLVKFLFTSDKLSVQVHPSDQYAREKENSEGKTEMWHVLKAEPAAQLAVGFREEFSHVPEAGATTLREAAESGAIENWLAWTEAREGDTFFVPAGTVHAIGAGLILCEIQQNSDITYRLYDYQRPGADGLPRPLHLEKAMDVLAWKTNGGRVGPLAFPDRQGRRLLLAACPYFAAEKLKLSDTVRYQTEGRCNLWIALEGAAEFDASGQRTDCRMGEVVIIPAGASSYSVKPASSCVMLRTYQPGLEADLFAPLRAQGFTDEQLRGVCSPPRCRSCQHEHRTKFQPSSRGHPGGRPWHPLLASQPPALS